MLKELVARYLNAPLPSKPERNSIRMTTEYLESRKNSEGIISDRYTNFRNCPQCGDQGTQERILKGFRWRTCERCEMDYVSKVLTEDFHIRQEFDHAVSHMKEATGQSGTEVTSKLDQDSIDYILNHFPDIGALVDIGCGAGNFLEAAKTLNVRLLGIDVNSAAREATSRRRIPALDPDSFAARSGPELDSPVIFTMRQVIEHVRDLPGIFDWIQKSVPGPWGLLIETPSNVSWSVRTLGYKHRHYDGWIHLQIMSPRTLEIIAEDGNLTLLNNSTYGESFGLRAWLQTRYAPWYYDPMSDEAVSRWKDMPQELRTLSDEPELGPTDTISRASGFRQAAVKSVRCVDSLAQYLRPGSHEYIRAALWKG